MARVAVAHLRRGDVIRIGPVATRVVSGVYREMGDTYQISLSIRDPAVSYNIRLVSGLRRRGTRCLAGRSEALIDTLRA